MVWTACDRANGLLQQFSTSGMASISGTAEAAAYLICIKYRHTLIPKHVADSRLAHACAACQNIREMSEGPTRLDAMTLLANGTDLCFPSTPEAGAI